MAGSRGTGRLALRTIQVAAIAAVAGGCIESCTTGHRGLAFAVIVGWAGTGKVPIPGVKTRASKLPRNDHVLRCVSARDGGGATFRPNREVWAPFRLEATLGLPDPAHADLGADGSFGVSITDGVDVFYIVDVKRSGAGIVVEARTTGANPLRTLTISDAFAADVAIETVGGAVVFSGRKHGDAAYTPIAAAALATAGPLQMSLDISGVPKRTAVGFDLFRLTTNGAPPSPTAVQTQRETIYTAIDALAEASYAIDGDAPDRGAAGDQLDLATTRLDAALAMDLPHAVRARAASARKRTHALVGGVRGMKGANSAIATIIKIVKLAGQAADALN